jgi:hypothetical protein
MIFVAEVGGTEVIVTMLAKGSRSKGTDPVFVVDAGMDWDGDVVPLCDEDRASVVDWVQDTYEPEVYGK